MESPLEIVSELVLLLAIILIAAKVGGEIAERFLRIPPVLGELAAGILIGPFALGGIEIGSLGPVFENPEVSGIPVAPQLFFVAQVAAIILLFQAGLETNRQQFIRYLRPASTVAIGGVIVPFVLGVVATLMLGFASLDSLQEALPALFVGAIMTATSVGITARVLADVRRLDTPEGVTVLAAAVVDDVMGLIILAIVVGINEEGDISAGSVGVIAAKAIGFWLGLTIIGSMMAGHISRITLWFRGAGGAVVIALGLAFLAAAVAETYFGLAMIIGAYSIGLALSDTELKHRIEEPMVQISSFLVPVFFVVIGMQVDFTAFGASEEHSLGATIAFAAVLTLFAIVSKMGGAGLPALAVGFNRRGAWRIALGMLPRGEVALIVAGIGLASGVIGPAIFAVAVLMTVVTTVVAPVLLVRAFEGGSGLRNPEAVADEATPRPGDSGGHAS